MKKDNENRFSAQNISAILVDSGVINSEQVENILAFYDRTRKKLEKEKAEKEAKSPRAVRISSPITAIDVVDQASGRGFKGS